MRNFITTILLCLIAVTTSVVYATDITENDVRQVITRIDRAIEQADAEALGDELSDDAVITVNFIDHGQNQVMRLSKREYLSSLKQGWAQFTRYRYQRLNLKIDLQGAKAFIAAKVHEEMTIDHQRYSSSSQEKATIELIDGKPMVTAATGHSGL